jgi:hypothetical protein
MPGWQANVNRAGLAGLHAALRRSCPGFHATGAPVRTGTSLLLPGTAGGVAVMAKQPTDPRAFWQDRCRHEITVYQALAAAGPAPVLTARLVAADPAHPLLVITRLPGPPLHPRRYPEGPVPPAALPSLLRTLSRLHQWHPAAAFPADGDYLSQLASYRNALIPGTSFARIATLCQAVMPAQQLEHGDAHLANAIAAPGGVALIDLECTAWRPAGYDLAKLWIYLGASPAARPAVLAELTSWPSQHAGFWIAVTLVAAREITSCQRQPDMPGTGRRLNRLHRDLGEALDHIRDLRAQLAR